MEKNKTMTAVILDASGNTVETISNLALEKRSDNTLGPPISLTIDGKTIKLKGVQEGRAFYTE